MDPILVAGEMWPGVAENLVAAGIGAALAGAAGATYSITKNFLIERKLNVAGDYISIFEDTQDGRRVSLYAHAKIRQRGRRFAGVSKIYANQSGSERDWELKGDLFDAGKLLGSYVCTTPHQSGMGTFSLAIQGRDLVGHWSGYDSQNNIMNHGVYRFMRVADVTIRGYRPADKPAVFKIAASTLGKGYFQSPEEYLKLPNAVVLVAVDQSRDVVGFCAGQVFPENGFAAAYPTIPKAAIPLDLRQNDSDGHVGVIQTIGVSPQCQGRGVGFRLLSEMQGALQSRSAKIFISPAWRAEEKTNIGGVLSAMSMQPFYTLSRYWKKECDGGEFLCPARHVSGEGCRCDVVLYKG